MPPYEIRPLIPTWKLRVLAVLFFVFMLMRCAPINAAVRGTCPNIPALIAQLTQRLVEDLVKSGLKCPVEVPDAPVQ